MAASTRAGIKRSYQLGIYRAGSAGERLTYRYTNEEDGCRSAPPIAIDIGNFTILRRKSALSIRMNAAISLKPSELATKSSIWAINALPWEPCGADAFGAPSKKNATGTCKMWVIRLKSRAVYSLKSR
jgi:hypothetical protein